MDNDAHKPETVWPDVAQKVAQKLLFFKMSQIFGLL